VPDPGEPATQYCGHSFPGWHGGGHGGGTHIAFGGQHIGPDAGSIGHAVVALGVQGGGHGGGQVVDVIGDPVAGPLHGGGGGGGGGHVVVVVVVCGSTVHGGGTVQVVVVHGGGTQYAGSAIIGHGLPATHGGGHGGHVAPAHGGGTQCTTIGACWRRAEWWRCRCFLCRLCPLRPLCAFCANALSVRLSALLATGPGTHGGPGGSGTVTVVPVTVPVPDPDGVAPEFSPLASAGIAPASKPAASTPINRVRMRLRA
jgi:hypothetical protein